MSKRDNILLLEDMLDAAIYKAMQDGDQRIAEEADLNDFENWLNE